MAFDRERSTAKALDLTGRAIRDGARLIVFRHSYASYHLAHFGDAAQLALEMGHTSPHMIFKHCRELVTRKKPTHRPIPAPPTPAGASRLTSIRKVTFRPSQGGQADGLKQQV